MTVIRLQRHAPEADSVQVCAVCGTTDRSQVTDHVQVGPPGTPTHDEGICDRCGAVLDRVVGRYGPQLTMLVSEAQQHPSGREITTARNRSARS
jgi:hypothetical protein